MAVAYARFPSRALRHKSGRNRSFATPVNFSTRESGEYRLKWRRVGPLGLQNFSSETGSRR